MRPSKYKIECPDCHTLMHVVQTKKYKGIIKKYFLCDKCNGYWRWTSGTGEWKRLENKVKTEQKISKEQEFMNKIMEDNDMKVKDLAIQNNMPVETYVEGNGFMPSWQYDVLEEEYNNEQIIKEEKEKQNKLDWDLIMSNLNTTVDKIWEE